MTNFIAVVEEHKRLRATLLAEYPELEGDPITLSDTLEGLTSASDAVAGYIRSALDDDALAEALAGRIKDMQERKARLQSRAERKRAIALALLNAVNLKKVEQEDFTASVCPSRPKVIVTDETALPPLYLRVKREPDKMALREALDAGTYIPGATLSNGGVSLVVRTK